MLATASRANTGAPSWNRRSLTQSQRPNGTVLVNGVAFDHLWLRGERLVQAIERIEHQVGMVMRRAVPAENRIEQCQIDKRNESEHLAGHRTCGTRRGEDQGTTGEHQ